ncbi:hypothetical protein J3E71DRAFT_210178 [Bipolaris maydis]|nr:hypothetical protein J3E71DRAFT_210178 [Bipolaris maydis]
MDPVTQQWPNRRLEILIPMWSMTLIATVFLVWRVVYGFSQSRRFMTSDYLLIIAGALSITATSLTQVITDNGLGRHIMDPTVLPNILKYSYFLWITQIVNIIAMAFLKWSICAWLLVLNFSKIYQTIIWLSILMVTALNFLAPVLTLFGCTPLEKNWNFGFKGESHCWAKGTLPQSYAQGISNVVTDVVYMAAPLIYLSRVQLNRRTQWGIRIVFLLSIPATICSIFKTIELKTIVSTRDPTWDGVPLTVWSGAELSLGIIIASLPPLRKAFDHFFSKILPSTLTGSSRTPAYGYGGNSTIGGGAGGSNGIPLKNFQGSKAYHSRIPGESVLDDDSDRAILTDEEEHKGPGIMKSMNVEVRVSEHGPPSGLHPASGSNRSSTGDASPPISKTFESPQIDWSSPHIESGNGGPGPRV